MEFFLMIAIVYLFFVCTLKAIEWVYLKVKIGNIKKQLRELKEIYAKAKENKDLFSIVKTENFGVLGITYSRFTCEEIYNFACKIKSDIIKVEDIQGTCDEEKGELEILMKELWREILNLRVSERFKTV